MNGKTPEPHQCAECWGYKMGEHIIHNDGCSKATTTTQIEPRGNEGYVAVKREKIEFWRTELLNKTDEVLKSMREGLGI